MRIYSNNVVNSPICGGSARGIGLAAL